MIEWALFRRFAMRRPVLTQISWCYAMAGRLRVPTIGVHGFFGASSMKRLPAVKENAAEFKRLKVRLE